MHNPLSPMSYLRRHRYPRSPYEQPIHPLPLVICFFVAAIGAIAGAVISLGLVFSLVIRRR